MSDLFERAEQAAEAIRGAFGGCAPEAGLILGSGLGAFGDRLEGAKYLPYEEVPGFPLSTVEGHKGRLVYGRIDGRPVIILQGRFHHYEGYPLSEVAFPVRVFGRLGINLLVVTNAAGGIGRHLHPGDLMLISDHLNLIGDSPLYGPNDDRFGPRFPDMTLCYPERLRDIVREHAPAGTPLKEGVYAAMHGPAYETPAEIQMVRLLGGDAVGMSTVPEVTVARQMGIPCVGISGIANAAAGLVEGHVLTHREVVETMAEVAEHFVSLLRAVLPPLMEDVQPGEELVPGAQTETS
ncbi:MAG: purine-nucleoside phosphorylase [Planctomycetota bacterium]|jgi:purine-nucleoside phosphorylase